MKNIKLLRIHHYIIIFCMLVAIYCIYNYLGIPFDAFKKASTIDVLTSEQVICNGSSFDGNKYKIEASDHCIIISGDEYRTIIMELAQGTNINNLRNEHIDRLMIPIPNDVQQIEFIRFLKQSDKSKFELQEAIVRIDNFIKSLIQQDDN